MTTSRRLGAALAGSVAALALLSVGSARAVGLDMLTITAPPDMTVPATVVCGQGDCAEVNYTFTVTGGYPGYNLVCNLPPGLFPVGTETVSCFAQDSVGDSTPSASFTITVTPGGPTPPPPPPPPPPLAITAPPDMTVPATVVCGQTDCAEVDYTFTVTGGYPGYNLVCNLPQGPFRVGTYVISCFAQDSEGDSTPSASFTLTVTPGGPTPPPPPPPPPPMAITAPPNITVPATVTCNGGQCAEVDYTFTVTGGYPPYNLVCNLPPGLFLLGSHKVKCLAQDSEGDSSPFASFTITVTPMVTGGSGPTGVGGGTGTAAPPTPIPTTPTPAPATGPPTAPTIAKHANITVAATSASGVRVSYSVISDTMATRSDVSCQPASGSMFPLGPRATTRTTTVTCETNDPAGAADTSLSFTVTVLGAQSQITTLEHTISATRRLPKAQGRSLVATLTHAQRSLDSGTAAKVESQLHLLLKQLRAIPAALSRQRGTWTAATTRIIDVVK